MSEYARSSANTEPQLLLDSGPMMLRDFNPKGVLRFQNSKCVTCDGGIMDHWLRPNDDPDLRAEWWCTKDGNVFSQGITDGKIDIPEGFGIQTGESK
jgi:hypothetical protein